MGDALFGPSRVDPPGTTVLDPPAERLDPPAERPGSPTEHPDPAVDPAVDHPDRGPVWTGDRLPNGRPDVSTVPESLWDDPRHDPSSLQYDGTPRGEHGYVGTVNPDVPSPSGLTHSGRLIDPDIVPPRLQPFIDSGAIVNDNGVLRLSQPVEVTFTLTNKNHDLAEFLRQGDLQERSLNQQSVADWQQHTAHYEQYDRVEGSAQTRYRGTQIQLRADALEVRNGLSPDAALDAAKKEANGLHVLHGPDQVAGGNPRQFTGLGDGSINAAYGRGWGPGGRAADLFDDTSALLEEHGIPKDLLGDIRLNVNIKVLVTRA